uniref:Uncharacterized protein n=1 Tax=Stomoxys calcitrans TaxID=35570 RepID=A0A1I8NQN1_STOCA
MGDPSPPPTTPSEQQSNNKNNGKPHSSRSDASEGGGDKQSEAGAGSTTNQEFRQNHPQPQQPSSRQQPPMPHELTAEWTVRAQLRFARAGETVRKDFSTNDPINPVRVVYKWSTLDADGTAADGEERHDDKHSDVFKRNSSRSSGYSHETGKGKSRKDCRKEESFRSTTSSTTLYGGADSAFSGSNTSHRKRKTVDPNKTPEPDDDTAAPFYGTRCRSTCNIIVSAVADFLPPPGLNIDEVDDNEVARHMSRSLIREEEPDPFVFNTTACYTVLPEKSFDEDSYTRSQKSKTYPGSGRILNLRDAICQTSDTETRYFEEYEHRRYKASHSPLERRDSRRHYDQRRATTEALMQQPHSYGSDVNEGNTLRPSYMPSSPSPAFKSTSMPRIPSIEGEDVSAGPSSHAMGSLPAFMASNKTVQSATEGQKKPRTVHIDVYCTGSEDEDHADAESSSESEDNRRHDQESNSTFQTVLDNEQMRLRHQRITGGSLPRRLGGQQQQQQKVSNAGAQPGASTHIGGDLHLGHGITTSNTTDEVNESKQLLFRKHIGDQRAIKLANLRQKYLRQSSDDALSMGYPSSTRSTVRDNTCSSLSSVLAGHDVVDTPTWKETDDNEDYSLTKSDSFEYENAMDRLRIRQMERLWSRSHSKEDEPTQQQVQAGQYLQTHPGGGLHHLQTISEVNTNTPQRVSPFRGGSRLQRDDTLPSESEFFSETDQSYGPYVAAGNTEQRNVSPIITTTSPTAGFHQTQHFSKSRPGFLQFFGPQNRTSPQPQPLSAPVEGSLLYPNYLPGLQRWKSETRENLSASPVPTPTERSRHSTPQPAASPVFLRCGSEAPPATTSASTFPTTTPTPVRRFDMFQPYRQSPAASDASSAKPPAGYSSEYLDKASKFGKVVPARKPGHHVGPTKNPNCSCESCQRWLAERFQVRGRAFSLGESAMLRRVKK